MPIKLPNWLTGRTAETPGPAIYYGAGGPGSAGSASTNPIRVISSVEDGKLGIFKGNTELLHQIFTDLQERLKAAPGEQVYHVQVDNLGSTGTKTLFLTNDANLAATLRKANSDPNAREFAKGVAAIAEQRFTRGNIAYGEMNALHRDVERVLADSAKLPEKVRDRFTYAERAMEAVLNGEKIRGFGVQMSPGLPTVLRYEALATSLGNSPEKYHGEGVLNKLREAEATGRRMEEAVGFKSMNERPAAHRGVRV